MREITIPIGKLLKRSDYSLFTNIIVNLQSFLSIDRKWISGRFHRVNGMNRASSYQGLSVCISAMIPDCKFIHRYRAGPIEGPL